MRFLTNLDVYGGINLFGELKVNDKNLITIGEDGGMQLASSAYFINDGDTKVTLNDLDVQIKSVRTDFDALVGNEEAISGAIDTFNEIKLFLADYQDSDLRDILDGFIYKNGINPVGDDFELNGAGIQLGTGALFLSSGLRILNGIDSNYFYIGQINDNVLSFYTLKNDGFFAFHDKLGAIGGLYLSTDYSTYISYKNNSIALSTGISLGIDDPFYIHNVGNGIALSTGIIIENSLRIGSEGIGTQGRSPILDFINGKYSPIPNNFTSFGRHSSGDLYVGRDDGTGTLFIGSSNYANIVTLDGALYLSTEFSDPDSPTGCKLSVVADEESGEKLLAVNDKKVVTFDDDETLGPCITMKYDPWDSEIIAKLSVDGLEFVESGKTVRFSFTGGITGPNGQMLETTRYGGYYLSNNGGGASVGVAHAGDDRNSIPIVHLGADAIRISTTTINGGDYNNDRYLEISRTPEGIGFNTYDTNTEEYLDIHINGHKILTEANFSIVKDITTTEDNENADGTYTTNVEHNFNFMYPNVSVYDSNNRLVVCNVVAISVNVIEITVNEAGTYHVSIRK